MITSCPGCNKTITESIKYKKFEGILQCTNCGLLYRVIPEHKFSFLSQNLYRETSWGRLRRKKFTYEQLIQKSNKLNMHALRMRHLVTEIQSIINKQEQKKSRNILSIGPGIGLFEFAWTQSEKTSDDFFILLEPSIRVHKKLIELQNDKLCLNGTLAEVKNSQVTFDLILCLGVDYLFEDLIGSLKLLNEKLSENGYLIISRNVYVDMECYFSGEKIKHIEDLVNPNPLINAFFVEEHYRLLLAEIFNLEDVDVYHEIYDNQNIGTHLNYFLKRNLKSDNFNQSPELYVRWKDNYDKILSQLKS